MSAPRLEELIVVPADLPYAARALIELAIIRAYERGRADENAEVVSRLRAAKELMMALR